MTPWVWSIDGWIVLVGVLSAVSCALPGNYLVLRRMSLMGDAISHAVLPGLAIAFLVSHSRAAWPMFVGAVVVGALTAVGTQVITRYGKVEHGAAMGVVFSVLFAVGLILIRRAADHVDLDPGCVLYGNLAQIPVSAIGGAIPPAAVNLGIATLLNVAFIALLYKELKICAFDPELATTMGINANMMHQALMIVVAVTAVANFEAVGSILVIAMLIVPGATAHLLTDSLRWMIVISVIIAAASAASGHTLAIWGPGLMGMDPGYSINTAAMMAVMSGVFFVLALCLSPEYGIVSRMYHRVVLSLQIVREDILGLMHRWQEMRPPDGRPITKGEVLAAVGPTVLAKWALWSLTRRRELRATTVAGARALHLTETGAARASQLVRAHRLWESYLARHFTLAEDHLHAPAARMEHFLSDEMQSQIASAVIDASHDPHGKPIPRGSGGNGESDGPGGDT